MLRQSIAAFFFLALPTLTNGFPAGAAGCPGGSAAVGGPHRSRIVRNGSLSRGDFELILVSASGENTTMVANRVNELDIDTKYTLAVKANTGIFRGLLVRFEGGRSSIAAADIIVNSTLLGDGGLRLVEDGVCDEGILGVTHNSASPKTESAFELVAEQEDVNIAVDVTVVVENRDTGSTYYYSRYWINVERPLRRGRFRRVISRFLPIC